MCHKCLCGEHRHSFLVYSSVLFKLIYLPFWGSKGIEPWYDFPVLSTQLFIPSQSIFSWLSILLNKPVSYLWSIFQRHLLSRIFTAPWECSNCFPNDLPELDSGSNLSLLISFLITDLIIPFIPYGQFVAHSLTRGIQIPQQDVDYETLLS